MIKFWLLPRNKPSNGGCLLHRVQKVCLPCIHVCKEEKQYNTVAWSWEGWSPFLWADFSAQKLWRWRNRYLTVGRKKKTSRPNAFREGGGGENIAITLGLSLSWKPHIYFWGWEAEFGGRSILGSATGIKSGSFSSPLKCGWSRIAGFCPFLRALYPKTAPLSFFMQVQFHKNQHLESPAKDCVAIHRGGVGGTLKSCWCLWFQLSKEWGSKVLIYCWPLAPFQTVALLKINWLARNWRNMELADKFIITGLAWSKKLSTEQLLVFHGIR